MALMIIGSLISGLFGIGTTAAQIGHEKEIHGQNYALQKENLEWQKEQFGIMQQREDNAVQRRVADLKAAGLSPTLAAGSAAQAHQPVSTQAPQKGMTNYMRLTESLNMASAYLQLQQQKKDIARTDAETERVREQIKSDQQNRTYQQLDYLLRERGVNLDSERVKIQQEQLGISREQLAHDAMRIVNDTTRISHDAQRLLNEGERIAIENNHLDLARLMNEAQRGLIGEQTFSEQLRQLGISYDSTKKFWELKELIYNLSLMEMLNLPTHGTLPQAFSFGALLGGAGSKAGMLASAQASGGSRRYYEAIHENDRRKVR